MLKTSSISVYEKKIEGYRLRDLYELSRRTTRYEAFLREESRSAVSYQLDMAPVEVDMAEFVKGVTVCEPLVKKYTKAKESVDADFRA